MAVASTISCLAQKYHYNKIPSGALFPYYNALSHITKSYASKNYNLPCISINYMTYYENM